MRNRVPSWHRIYIPVCLASLAFVPNGHACFPGRSAQTFQSADQSISFTLDYPEAQGMAPVSELRRNGELLWVTDWQAWDWTILALTNDGTVIRSAGHAQSLDDEGVAFFRDGKLLRQYSIRQFLSTTKGLSAPYCGFDDCGNGMAWIKSSTWDEATQTLRVEALTGDVRAFDGVGNLIKSVNATDTVIDYGRVLELGKHWTRMVELYQSQATSDLTLPKGTKVEISSNERIIQATLILPLRYQGSDVPAGSKLHLASLLPEDSRCSQIDQFSDMKVRAIDFPAPAQIDPITASGNR